MCLMHLTKPQEILTCYTKEAEVYKSEVMIKSMLTYKSHHKVIIISWLTKLDLVWEF